MRSLVSKDGTAIAFTVTGSGPPLVLVHGTTADHTRWAPLIPELAETFTVYAVDRRGRGGSGDAASYALERDVEDVVAVVESAGGGASVLGHSFGGLCAIEAALRTPIEKLVIYEAPMPTGQALYDAALIARLEALLAAGERASVLRTFFLEIVRIAPAELAQLESLPNWPSRIAAAATIPRELRAVQDYVAQPARLRTIDVPTLLLLGGESAPFFRESMHLLADAIPRSKLTIFAGQQHTAMNTAPELFLREVVGWLVTAA